MKYRIVKELSLINPKTGLTYTHRTIIKAGFDYEELAEAWNVKYGNSGYIIEPY